MPGAADLRRARRWFWVLLVVAVAATGVLEAALSAAPSPGTGLVFLASSLVLAGALVQATRVWCAISGQGRRVSARPE